VRSWQRTHVSPTHRERAKQTPLAESRVRPNSAAPMRCRTRFMPQATKTAMRLRSSRPSIFEFGNCDRLFSNYTAGSATSMVSRSALSGIDFLEQLGRRPESSDGTHCSMITIHGGLRTRSAFLSGRSGDTSRRFSTSAHERVLLALGQPSHALMRPVARLSVDSSAAGHVRSCSGLAEHDELHFGNTLRDRQFRAEPSPLRPRLVPLAVEIGVMKSTPASSYEL